MTENFFRINGLNGERILSGDITVAGAKNAALKVMAAAILFSDHIELSDVPEIEDVERMSELLQNIGCRIEKSKNRRKIIVPEKIDADISGQIAQTMRSSIVLTGPALSRTGKVSFPNPGGCNIGNRPIDIFLEGFERMGAKIETKNNIYIVTAPNGLQAMEFFFKVQSHTGTETLMMAAVLAKGKTVLKNCALEPEVKSLADFLNACGADIKGAGTSTVVIHGGKILSSGTHTYETMPDRIETGSFMILSALAAKKVTIRNCIPEHVEIITEVLRSAGVKIETGKREITVYGQKNLTPVNVRTHEYPGLPTDLQAVMGVFLTQTNGESTLLETIYEERLGYIPDLVTMGAHIKKEDNHRAIIQGPTRLVGRKIKAPDLRAGFAFLVAAIIGKGESIIENAYVIDRGYERLTERLSAIGVAIQRS